MSADIRPQLARDAHGDADASADELEIDRILADSFPASDPPPWTLGVEPGGKPHRDAAKPAPRRPREKR